VNAHTRDLIRSRRGTIAVLGVFGVAAVAVYWKFAIVCAGMLLIAWIGYRSLHMVSRYLTDRTSRDHQLVARADHEYQLWDVHGDAHGFYGQYPPAC
jgi:hypothetical protein